MALLLHKVRKYLQPENLNLAYQLPLLHNLEQLWQILIFLRSDLDFNWSGCPYKSTKFKISGKPWKIDFVHTFKLESVMSLRNHGISRLVKYWFILQKMQITERR